MAQARNDLAKFIIDLDDERCDNHSIHLASYQGDCETLEKLIRDDPAEISSKLNFGIRPFLATPLRLAATAGHLKVMEILVTNGAQIDMVDIKQQTPLFVALVNQHWDCAAFLLENGANPNGNPKNLCTPMSVMAQRGHFKGVKLLCEFGADTEDTFRLRSGMPGLPLAIAATYHHLECFAILLLFGAKPGLSKYESLDLPDHVITQCSIPHAMIKYKCPPEFVYLYHEFGGNLWLRDSKQRLATELSDNDNDSHCKSSMQLLQEMPLSLQSACRNAIRRNSQLANSCCPGLTRKLSDFVQFRDLYLSINQVACLQDLAVVEKLTAVLRDLTKEGPLTKRRIPFHQENSPTTSGDEISCKTECGKTPPPVPTNAPAPPAPPPPPKPGFWRFPGAEFADKGMAHP